MNIKKLIVEILEPVLLGCGFQRIKLTETESIYINQNISVELNIIKSRRDSLAFYLKKHSTTLPFTLFLRSVIGSTETIHYIQSDLTTTAKAVRELKIYY